MGSVGDQEGLNQKCLPTSLVGLHSDILKLVIYTPHAKEQVFIRFYKMVRTMMKSYNHRMPFLARSMSPDARSITGKNLRIIASHYNIDSSDINSDKQHVCLHNGLTQLGINNLFSPCATMYSTCDILYNIVPDIFCV